LCSPCLGGEFFIEIAIARVLENLVSTAVKDGVTLGFLEYSEAALKEIWLVGKDN
jgi:hypothetical protein